MFTDINLSRSTHVRSDVKLENGFSSGKIFSVKNVGKAESVWVEHEDEEAVKLWHKHSGISFD